MNSVLKLFLILASILVFGLVFGVLESSAEVDPEIESFVNNFNLPKPQPIIIIYDNPSFQFKYFLIEFGNGVNGAIGIDFDTRSPNVKAPRLYVMYILADGTMTDGTDTFTIGPLAEVVLQICPGNPAVCPT